MQREEAESTSDYSMDKVAKRNVGSVSSGSQGSFSRSVNSSRLNPGASAFVPASSFQPVPSTTTPGSSSNSNQYNARGKGSGRANFTTSQNNRGDGQARNNRSGGRGGGGGVSLYSGGSVKGGIQPSGLGSFAELGLNGLEQGSRKHNYAHLLNLDYSRRGEEEYAAAGRGRHHGRWEQYGTTAKYSKEQFIQANCQFIVKEDGDYAVHHVDPDVLVEWDKIEQIRICGQEGLSCPICLHEPVAAKITRCGHVFCWPCILHYLALSDAEWRKCPICYESVYEPELKSFVSEIRPLVKAGMEVTMRLMLCPRGSVWPFPFTEYQDRRGLFYNIKEKQASLAFSKILTIKPEQIQSEVVAKEESELLFAMSTEGDTPEACFIEAALKSVHERVGKLGQSSVGKVEEKVEKVMDIGQAKKVYASAFSDEEVDEAGGAVGTKTLVGSPLSISSSNGSMDMVKKMKGTEEKKGKNVMSSPSYFYQSANGQHIYLHPINVRMLAAQYGQLSQSPPEITSQVLEVETWSVTQDIRKRYRYLSHLPLTCVIHLVEVELKPPYISEEVMHAFEQEVQQRETLRTFKIQTEEGARQNAENAFRRDIRGQMVSSLQGDIYRRQRDTSVRRQDLDLASQEMFPVVGTEPTPSPAPAATPAKDDDAPSTSRSFAQMLRQGKVQKGVEGPSSSNWGQQGKSVNAGGRERRLSDEADSGGEGTEHLAPDFARTFSSGLDAAFSRLQVSSTPQPAGSASKASKKKKKTATILFSTGDRAPRV